MKIKLNIEGMKCEGCMNRIQQVLNNIKGIENSHLSLKDATLSLELKQEKIVDEIIEKISELGFTVTK